MRALVTGGAGFVGGRIAQRLLDRGDSVTVVDSFTDYYDVAWKRATAASLEEAGAVVIEGDLNSIDLDPLVQVDTVFHQAGQPGVRKSWGRDFAMYLDANVAATQRLLEAVHRGDSDARVVYASSSSVYGSAETYPTTERAIPRPKSPYGVSKLAAEHLCGLYAENFGVDTVSLRYFTVYGPRQRPDMAFTRFVLAALRGEPIHIFGDGEQVRDFTFIDDIVDANLAAAGAEVAPGAVFNVSGGTDCTVNEVLAILANLVGHPLNVRYGEPVPGDVRRTGGDSTRFRDLTGWQPRVALADGLAAQLRWATGEGVAG